MLAASLKVTTSDGEIKRVALLTKHEEFPCVELASFQRIDYKIREPHVSVDKVYNFYFPGGILSCTASQKVLCQGRKIISVGEALISKIRIHSCSGLVLPHYIENSSPKSQVYSIVACGHNSRAAVISSIFCV